MSKQVSWLNWRESFCASSELIIGIILKETWLHTNNSEAPLKLELFDHIVRCNCWLLFSQVRTWWEKSNSFTLWIKLTAQTRDLASCCFAWASQNSVQCVCDLILAIALRASVWSTSSSSSLLPRLCIQVWVRSQSYLQLWSLPSLLLTQCIYASEGKLAGPK